MAYGRTSDTMSIVLKVLQRRLAPLHDDVRPQRSIGLRHFLVNEIQHGFYPVGDGIQLFFTGLQPELKVGELRLTIGSDNCRQEGNRLKHVSHSKRGIDIRNNLWFSSSQVVFFLLSELHLFLSLLSLWLHALAELGSLPPSWHHAPGVLQSPPASSLHQALHQ